MYVVLIYTYRDTQINTEWEGERQTGSQNEEYWDIAICMRYGCMSGWLNWITGINDVHKYKHRQTDTPFNMPTKTLSSVIANGYAAFFLLFVTDSRPLCPHTSQRRTHVQPRPRTPLSHALKLKLSPFFNKSLCKTTEMQFVKHLLWRSLKKRKSRKLEKKKLEIYKTVKERTRNQDMNSFSRVLSPPRLITEERNTYPPVTSYQGVRRSGTLDTFIQGTK